MCYFNVSWQPEEAGTMHDEVLTVSLTKLLFFRNSSGASSSAVCARVRVLGNRDFPLDVGEGEAGLASAPPDSLHHHLSAPRRWAWQSCHGQFSCNRLKKQQQKKKKLQLHNWDFCLAGTF